ncbi:MAG: NAD(P)(+) transhydrogenase (Re/Si-specific) subunit beta [Phycisphaerales bacterium]|nr:NAD(P)(+) transhydrogenase (Re/Si-specific) subunit beta [Phycisphaerales bacterium]MCI0630548.1 NAD(P)(+) transhydrogenase (Re/Si-specific) subunit beta [Phycisphaerales bacterium]
MTACTLSLAVSDPAERWFVNAVYIIAAALFILSLKWLSAPKTARRGVFAGEFGMLLAVVGTLLNFHIVDLQWVLIGIVIGSLIGIPMALWMPMTAVPQRTALSHAFGALAAALVGTAHYYLNADELPSLTMGILGFEVLLGALTFTGSLMAFGKLQELLPSAPMTFKNQNIFNLSILGAAVLCGVLLTINPGWTWLFPIFLLLATAFGVLLIMPIGGADMPTVIALLNSYAGLSASMMGFVLDNKLLIVAGALDGSSGFILAIIMCKAMNRSFTNVLFGAFGATSEAAKADDVYGGKIKSATADDVAMVLDGARRIVIVPGYGMAVSQAQHAVRDLANLIESRGGEVEYAIHPVAGRMPGHMNVLLAEADIPYEKLKEMDEINSEIEQFDVAIIVGANDTVNPLARTDPKSAIAGMPIINADKARTVVVIKRSLSPGFAGIPNPLFSAPNTLMYFSDGKKAVIDLIAAMKAA